MRTVHFGCIANDHGHEALLTRRPVPTEHEHLPEVLITLWRCNVLHTGGVLLEFPGPNDKEDQADERTEEPEGRRRLFHRD